jgi:hypothetical protein
MDNELVTLQMTAKVKVIKPKTLLTKFFGGQTQFQIYYVLSLMFCQSFPYLFHFELSKAIIKTALIKHKWYGILLAMTTQNCAIKLSEKYCQISGQIVMSSFMIHAVVGNEECYTNTVLI